jgi:hypothetical protein
MIVWGGVSAGPLAHDRRALQPRDGYLVIDVDGYQRYRRRDVYESVIWTGSEMIVWGGSEQSVYWVNTGARLRSCLEHVDPYLSRSERPDGSQFAQHRRLDWIEDDRLGW